MPSECAAQVGEAATNQRGHQERQRLTPTTLTLKIGSEAVHMTQGTCPHDFQQGDEMDKQTKDKFAELLLVDVGEVSDGYWLKLIASLLFFHIRTNQ